MPDEILSAQQLTREGLMAIFDAAFMAYHLDGDGDIVVDDNYNILVMLSAEKQTLTLLSSFRASPEVTPIELYTYVNGVNDNLIGIRAYVTPKPSVCFDFTLLTNGGLTARQIVLSIRRFSNLLGAALRRDTTNVIPAAGA